jgi:hypothetical protein
MGDHAVQRQGSAHDQLAGLLVEAVRRHLKTHRTSTTKARDDDERASPGAESRMRMYAHGGTRCALQAGPSRSCVS